MNTRGLFSVVVPTFNRAETIIDALESVRRQTYRPIELIVVDDGSTDNTVPLVEAWASRAEHANLAITLLRQDNAGAPVARNRGALAASGAFVQFLDSDDSLDCDKLRLHAEHFAHHTELDVSIGQSCMWSPPYASLHAHRAYSLDQIERLSISWSPFSTLGPAIRARVFKHRKHLWDEALGCCQDWEYFTRLLQQGLRFAYCLEARAYIRPSSGRARTGHHDRAITPRLAAARLAQLASLWNHASTERRNDVRFALPWCLQYSRWRVLCRSFGGSADPWISTPIGIQGQMLISLLQFAHRPSGIARYNVPGKLYYRLCRLLDVWP